MESGGKREGAVCQLLDLTVPSESLEPVFQELSFRPQFLKAPVLPTPSSWGQISRRNELGATETAPRICQPLYLALPPRCKIHHR